jgi:glycosyltransferase involved in cell wall biosynthesis
MEPMLDLTIVLPIYNEEENIEPLISEIQGVLRTQNLTYEIVAIDDGSKDRSLEILKTLARSHTEIRVFSFRGNRGQSAAFDAGFRHSNGRIIITMDSDGQNDPADIPKLVKLIEDGNDFVTGRRKDRKDGLFIRKIPSKIANWIIRKVTKTKVHDLGCSLKAYRAEIAKELMLYGEMHRFISVLAEMNGAKIAELDVNHRPRMKGESKYGLTRTFKVLFDLTTIWYFINYHTKPIYVFGALSLSTFFGSVVISAYVLYEKYFQDVFVHRNPLFIIAAVLLILSIQFLVFGLLAEVLIRTYFESQNKRPYSFKFVSDGKS